MDLAEYNINTLLFKEGERDKEGKEWRNKKIIHTIGVAQIKGHRIPIGAAEEGTQRRRWEEDQLHLRKTNQ